MVRFRLLVLIVLFALTFSACAPSGFQSAGPTIEPGTAITVQAATASVGTAVAVIVTPLPPNYTPPPPPPSPTSTPIPTIPNGLGPTELKYRVLAEFPDFFFCDPDYYPIARADELDLAIQRFPEIQANEEMFHAILAHNNLTGTTIFSDDQKLLIYQQYKRLNAIHFELIDPAYQFQIQVAKTEGQGELVTGTIDGQGKITVKDKKPSFATCPICLAAGTLIDTPVGAIPVQEIRVGTLVWTVGKDGIRVAQPVIKVGKTLVPITHEIVQLILSDGREVRVSPGHPTGDGRRVGQLQAGDHLDGATVVSAQRVRYAGGATYDLLPDGGTGFYWANGVLLASTLRDGY